MRSRTCMTVLKKNRLSGQTVSLIMISKMKKNDKPYSMRLRMRSPTNSYSSTNSSQMDVLKVVLKVAFLDVVVDATVAVMVVSTVVGAMDSVVVINSVLPRLNGMVDHAFNPVVVSWLNLSKASNHAGMGVVISYPLAAGRVMTPITRLFRIVSMRYKIAHAMEARLHLVYGPVGSTRKHQAWNRRYMLAVQ